MAVFSPFIVILIIIGSTSVVMSQMTCYSCSGRYTTEEGLNDQNEDCFTTTSLANASDTVNCQGQCSTQITVSSPYINIRRGCKLQNAECNDCTDLEDCQLCCTEPNCNDDELLTVLRNNDLTQRCYSCRYSEVPGVPSEDLCAQENPSGVDVALCPGMCYVSSSYIPGVEDIVRGCAFYGNGCDSNYYTDNNPYNNIERNGVHFRRTCCNGNDCNTGNSATNIKPGTFALTTATILVMFAASYSV